MVAWNLAQLKHICAMKHIGYEESEKFSNLVSVTVRFKDTYIICVRSDLPEPQKVVAIAHEFAHCALRHTFQPQGQHFPTFVFVQGPERETEARIWASHLLMAAEVYDDEFRSALVLTRNRVTAEQDAITVTALRLAIPKETVALWVKHRTASFAISPTQWLEAPDI